MLGAEQNHPESPHHLGHPPDPHAVLLYDPFPPSAENAEGQALRPHRIVEAVHQMGGLLPEADQLGLLDGSEALAQGGKVNRLQKVGLSLGVVSVEEIHPLGKGNRRRPDIAEILNFYAMTDRADHLAFYGKSVFRKCQIQDTEIQDTRYKIQDESCIIKVDKPRS